MHVLFIDGSPAAASLLLTALSSTHSTVTHSQAVADAVTHVDSAVDIILLDVELDQTTTDTHIQTLTAVMPNVPVVVVSNYHDDEKAADLVRAGAADFLQKAELTPFRLQQTITHADASRRIAQRRTHEHDCAQLLNSSRDGIVIVDTNGIVCYSNAAARRLLTGKLEPVPGQSLEPAVLLAGDGEFSAPTSDNPFGTLDLHRDQVTWQNAPASLITARDITADKVANQALRESEQRFQELTALIPEVFWLKDPRNNEILYVSPAFEKVFDTTPVLLYTSPDFWFDFIHPDDRDRIIAAAGVGERAKPYDEEYRIIRSDGSIAWLRERVFLLRDDHNRATRIAGIAEDISPLKELENQFGQRQKVEAIGRMAQGVAHYFNNLLPAIAGHCELIKLGLPKNSEFQVQLNGIAQCCEQAGELVETLTAFDRLPEIDVAPLRVDERVREVTTLLRPIIGETIVIDVDTERAGYVSISPGNLDLIVTELIIASRDAMPSTGGCIKVRCQEVDVVQRRSPGKQGLSTGTYVELVIEHNGYGMRADELAQIGEPIFTSKAAGVNLGLSYVFHLVCQHGGHLTAVNKEAPWRGTRFTVLFPRSTRRSRPTATDDSTSDTVGGTETILVLEDDQNMRMMIQQIIERYGYTAVSAANGNALLEAVRHHKGRIDLLIADVVVPGKPLSEVITALKHHDDSIPTLFLSGYTPDYLSKFDLPITDTNFISKPFAPTELLKKIRQILSA